MKYDTATIFITLLGLASAAPLVEREVPQEHSHEEILLSVDKSLKLDNPDKIVNPVFGLLGDKAAADGAGNIKNLDCLQRAIADRAFTNEKKAGNVDGMANALIFAALEKNTGAVGKASNTCNDPAVNPEITAISQHQDPAGTGAQESNKKIVLALAVQLSSIGADPQLAAKSATFAPGKLGDPTAAGNSCDDKDDKVGCIFTKKLIQVEATPEEIDAAVKDAGGSKNTGSTETASSDCKAGSSDSKAASSDNKAGSSDSKAADEKSTDKKASDSWYPHPLRVFNPLTFFVVIVTHTHIGAATPDDKATGNNVQSFTGDLGGLPPAVIETPGSGRAFSVNGNTFVGKGAALQRSCAIQHNACANEANKSGGKGAFSVSDCGAQETECNNAAIGPSAGAKRSVVGV
ncbi:hypothetical protein K3495_g13099 [Podosphaera aphanis]|nr:hypothetical protein K3495_g13099 [Podosphaera aphanis]